MEEAIKRVHFAPKYFMNPTHPITVNLIGCGGTGSLVLPRLARMDSVLQAIGHPGLYVTVYDADIVEKHNLGRQNFTYTDLNQNKAVSLVEKINMAYGLNWNAIPQYAKANECSDANIIITAVDNAKFRMQLAKEITQSGHDYKKCFYWLDCGNGRDFGQVVLSTVADVKQPESKFDTVARLKSVVDIYGNLVTHDTKEVQGIDGCSVEESLIKQDLFINDDIAMQAMKLLWQLIRNYNVSVSGAVVNQGSFKQVPIMV